MAPSPAGVRRITAQKGSKDREKDGDPHTVTSTTGIWASDALDTDSQFARVFTTVGTFPYYCTIHPYMHGMIVVKS